MLHLIAKQNVILLKNDKIILLTWPPINFLDIKMSNLKILINF